MTADLWLPLDKLCEFQRKPAAYSEMKPAGGSEVKPATHSET
jgi:hypothetical protein